MVPALPATLVSSLSSGQGEKVKLRVSYGGDFVADASGKWSYRGGKNHVDTLPVSFKYGDVAFRWTEKVKGDLTGLKYQLPGEELEPDALITVSDDNDLQEMFEEYFRGLKVASSTARTFHLRVFLFFDLIQEPLTPAEYADGYDFFRTSSGMQRREAPSYTEWDASSFGSNASMESAGTHAHRGKNHEQAICAAKDVLDLYREEMMRSNSARAPGFAGSYPVPSPALDDSAFMGSSQPSSNAAPGSDPAPLPLQQEQQKSRYLFHTQDPWYANFGDAPPGTAGALVTLATTPSKKKASGGAQPGSGFAAAYFGTPRKPTSPALGALALPSHISIFGDAPDDDAPAGGGGGSCGAASCGAGVRLPSHISAFGEDVEHDEELLYAARALVGAPPPPHPPICAVAGAFQPGAPSPGVMSLEPGALAAAGAPNTSYALYDNVHRVPKDEVKVLGRIGEGAFGEVSLATCAIFGKVAVKWLKPGKVEAHSASFWREADMLASLNHPNVLRFYGAVVASAEDPAVVGIMTEYMRGGSLSHFLTNRSAVIPLRLRAELALHAVNGLAYLHEMKIVHFDLKPDNLLLDGPLVLHPGYAAPAVKVADFGLSKHKWNSYVSGVRDLRGTLPYMAPELVSDPDHVSEKADVWSLGMVLWEMLALRTPFQHLSPQQIIAGLMVGNLAPEVPAWCEPEWRGLMEACWDVNPVSRPSFRVLAQHLQEILDDLAPPPLALL